MLKGTSAIITGSRRGIGRACVEVFAEHGANVWACARERDDAFERDMAELAEKFGVWIEPIYFELRDEGRIKEAVKKIRSRKTKIGALVNNAGMIPTNASFAMMSGSSLRDVFEVNFFQQAVLTQYIARVMMQQKNGSIVNISSIASIDGEPGQFEYVTSRAASAAAARKLALELGEHGIRVNAVAPGVIDTDMGNAMQPAMMDRILGSSALKRKGAPREVAETIAFLASDRASYITGQIIRVDGGI